MKNNQKRTVLRNIFLSVFIGISLFTLGISYWVYRDVEHDSVKDLKYISSVIGSYYELSFKQWELTLLSVGTRLTEFNGENAAEDRLYFANKALKEYSDQLLAFGFADTLGQVITFTGMKTTDSLPNLMASKNSRRSFIQVKESDDLVIGEVYYFPNVKDWIIPIRVPIRDVNGQLLAVNTSAINYHSLLNELKTFGVNENYRIHLINTSFNTTQLLYPLDSSYYTQYLQQSAEIYTDYVSLLEIGNIEYFNATSIQDGQHLLGIKSHLKGLDHSLIIAVPTRQIRESFWASFQMILLVYVLLSIGLFLLISYFKKKQNENLSELETERANLKSLFESTNSIIGLFDANQRLIQFNRSFSEYAKSADGIELYVGMDVMSHMKNSELASKFRENQHRVMNGEKFKETIEYPTSNGVLHFMFSYNPIYQGKEITGVSMFVEDITALKTSQKKLEEYNQKLEEMVADRTKEIESKNNALEKTLLTLKETQEQLVQSEKMASLGVLSAGIGHEINNPLNFIKNGHLAMIAELERKFPGSKEELKPFLDIIEDGVNRATTIVKSLSHFSRKGGELNEKCNIHEILDNCLIILGNRLKSHIQIEKNYSTEPLILLGSEGKLHQAFLNILTNAEQSIESEGKITIKTEKKDGKVWVSIKDTGCGIAESNLSKIADPFFTTKPPGIGTGLGLFITFAIIDEHKGKINVYSKQNLGTEITVTL